MSAIFPEGVEIHAQMKPGFEEILTPEAVGFVAMLARAFTERRDILLVKRGERQVKLDAGELPHFLSETAHIRNGDWQIAPVPADLQDRRVEITGPTDRKMVINALNSGAKVFMADFEDANAPTWDNMIEGQINLRDAIRRTITYSSPEGKNYKLNDNVAGLMVRPRGWHLDEKHMLVDGKAVPGGLFDFGLYFYTNAKELLARGSGPYFYLPKLENHLEARLWNDVFELAQEVLGVAPGSIKATVLIETILAALETEEILYELRDHSAGLNCGRWDYIFSFIKKFRTRPDYVLPDRALVTMTVPMMRNYSLLVIKNCHKHGAHAMGGMAAQIPIKNNPEANEAALAKVRADKLREAQDGHDGTWVAHPGLVPVALEVFDEVMPQSNQVMRQRDDIAILEEDLLRVPEGPITEQGVRWNIKVGIQYVESWLQGNGCVPLYHLMEDAATAEISRTQIWQWLKHHSVLADGRPFTEALYDQWLQQEMAAIRSEIGNKRFDEGEFARASQLFIQMSKADPFVDFLTLPAYQFI